jgi:hypothetical protein
MSAFPREHRAARVKAVLCAANAHQQRTTMKTEFIIWALALVNLAACSSEGDILPKKERFGRPDATFAEEAGPDIASDGRKPRDPNANCVKPGTPNNERDVGGYCEPGRGDCESEQGPRFCTADFAELTTVEDDKWFCTAVCLSDSECGTGVICAESAGRKGCAPVVCASGASTPSP